MGLITARKVKRFGLNVNGNAYTKNSNYQKKILRSLLTLILSRRAISTPEVATL
jgi:hypothetical protein